MSKKLPHATESFRTERGCGGWRGPAAVARLRTKRLKLRGGSPPHEAPKPKRCLASLSLGDHGLRSVRLLWGNKTVAGLGSHWAGVRASLPLTESGPKLPSFVLSLALLAILTILSGCAHRYLMTFTDGNQVISISKPKLKGAHYHFRDEAGGECVIPTERVAKIATGA